MTLPRLDAIVEHWEKVPPLSVSVAAIASVLGVGRADKGKPKGPREPAAQVELDPAKVQGLFEMLGGAGFATEKPSWLTAAAGTM